MTRTHRLATGLALALLTLAPAAQAQHAPEPAPASMNLQGNDPASWIADPHIHEFYAAVVAAFAKGPSKVDVPALEARSFAIFRAFGASRGVPPEAMQDHLKLIPGQVVQVAREDPHVLDSYDNFVAAVFGPQ